MSIHDDKYYQELDRRYNGSKYDFDERVQAKLYKNKKCAKVRIDLTDAIYIDPITQQKKFKGA
jgi:hypothetical protein